MQPGPKGFQLFTSCVAPPSVPSSDPCLEEQNGTHRGDKEPVQPLCFRGTAHFSVLPQQYTQCLHGLSTEDPSTQFSPLPLAVSPLLGEGLGCQPQGHSGCVTALFLILR